MANTYSQLFVHIIFSVSRRQKIIPRSRNCDLQKYITGIIKRRGHKLFTINNEPDHIHILISIIPTTCLSDLVREIKCVSSKFINEGGWIKEKFAWQKGYGAFSCCHSHIDMVKKYIQNQHEHHRRESYKEEYLKILEAYRVKYDSKYVLD